MTAKQVVQRFYAELGKGNREAAFQLLDQNFVLKQASSLPYGGHYKGTEALLDFFQKFNGYWKEFQTLSTEFYEMDNKIFAMSSIRGVNQVDRLIETEMIQVYEIENQKILSAQPFYFDTALLVVEQSNAQ
ncbi:MAG: nuclear transport factor 2 family protein [Bacteroidota bacterium]